MLSFVKNKWTLKIKSVIYIGKIPFRPEYAPDTSDEEDEDELELKLGVKVPSTATLPSMTTEAELEDRRLRRLLERRRMEQEEEDRWIIEDMIYLYIFTFFLINICLFYILIF